MRNKLPIVIILLIISNSIFAQLKYDYQIEFEEMVINEDLIFIEEVFGDGEWKLIQNRIISQKQIDDVLELKIGITSLHESYSGCKIEFKEELLFIEFIPTKSIDEILENYTSYREINLKVEGLKTRPKKIFFNQAEIFISKEKFKISPEKFEVIGNDTLNRYDRYGQRQGKWIKKLVTNEIENYYVDSKLVKGILRSFFENGQLESMYIKYVIDTVGNAYYRQFFQSGEIKEENYHINTSPAIYKITRHTNNKVFQEFSYTGEEIVIKQFKVNGDLECECNTKIGVEYFQGFVANYKANQFEIPCKIFDKDETREEKRFFKLYWDIMPK